jgi:hypothetical protein
MLRGGSPREEFFADETLAHVLTDEDKDFADLVDVDGVRV